MHGSVPPLVFAAFIFQPGSLRFRNERAPPLCGSAAEYPSVFVTSNFNGSFRFCNERVRHHSSQRTNVRSFGEIQVGSRGQ